MNDKLLYKYFGYQYNLSSNFLALRTLPRKGDKSLPDDNSTGETGCKEQGVKEKGTGGGVGEALLI